MLGLCIYTIDITFSRKFYTGETKEKLPQCSEETVENANEILERLDQRFKWKILKKSTLQF